MKLEWKFFATGADLAVVLQVFESSTYPKYIRHELREDAVFNPLMSFRDIPKLGENQSGKSLAGEAYLVTSAERQILVEGVPQRRGGTRYVVDQLYNPESFLLRPNGVCEEYRCVVCGIAVSVNQTPESMRLLAAFGRALRVFQNVKGYYVGAQALSLRDENNFRLVTMHWKEPKEYDLT